VTNRLTLEGNPGES